MAKESSFDGIDSGTGTSAGTGTGSGKLSCSMAHRVLAGTRSP